MSSGKIVLAIDDNLQQLAEFKSILVPRYDLRVVKSASEAIAFLNKSNSDIILLDIEMPNISGFEFLSDIRKIPSYMSTPVIIISGHYGVEFIDKVKNSSATGYLTKPVKPEALIGIIEETLSESN
jgi:PleD family two-component response regulator